MKSILKLSGYLCTALILASIIISCQPGEENLAPQSTTDRQGELNNTPITDQYIVVYKKRDQAGRQVITDYKSGQEIEMKRTSDFLQEMGITEAAVLRVYGNSIQGFVAKLSKDQAELLKQDDRVAFVEQDKIIALAPPPGKGPGSGGGDGGGSSAQETPWGITRVNGGVDGTGKTAWVIDSGIDLDHPDLNVDGARSASFLRKGGPDDENGHGTHVAGTIAAIDNNEGVIGVAAGATVVSVRVLDRRGSGSLSGVIAGVDYVGANASSADVANMSLGGGVSQSLDQAVIDAAQASGATFVLAAGNESDNANNHSPARANGNNIVTISASDSNDNFAYFSNYGNPPIDWCAPGVSIKSTWKSGGYNTISGTSMAAPHAAGVLLLGAGKASGTVNGDPDGNPDSIISH
jgi:subtilisin family serine protease